MRTLLYFLISSDYRNLVHHTATGFVVRTLQASNFAVRVIRYYLIIARILKLFGLKRLLQFCCWAYAFSASFRSKTWTGVANQRRGRNPGHTWAGVSEGDFQARKSNQMAYTWLSVTPSHPEIMTQAHVWIGHQRRFLRQQSWDDFRAN